jgi:hypothetical protein
VQDRSAVAEQALVVAVEDHRERRAVPTSGQAREPFVAQQTKPRALQAPLR